MLEIERKFLINEIPEDIGSCEKQEILQGYFKHYKKNIRVRQTIHIKKGRKHIKYHMTQKQGKGLVRQETEKEISEKQFKDYREFAQHNQIKKTRYLFQYKKDVIEINQFHDKLDGLRMAEVEFGSIKESEKFVPPSWFDKEITNQKEGNNSYLAMYGINKLIKKNYYQDNITCLQLKSFYNKESKKYSQTRKKHRADADTILQTIENYPEKNIKILELGCGGGRLLQHLNQIKDKKIDYIGVDLSENLLEESKKIKLNKNIKSNFICSDMIKYLSNCKQENIDIIIGIASFQHLINKKQRFLAAKYMYRNLKYDGIIIMTNRSFSTRMIKKHRKTLLESIIKKIINWTKNERNNLMIPWKSDLNIYKRFYHIFTKSELKKIFSQSGFIINKLAYKTKNGIETNDRKDSNNTIIIAKKTIFSL
ncbi:MAG: methyltransferase domain-containing protein [Candidatus Absconditabacteria bacterium]|nr:methyltransferase domain-containing protein [Candidatus Absconditabacteria bacterium]